MNNAILNFPVPANEPVKAYLEGSPERIALDAELERQWNTVVDIPIIIGGKEIRTGNTGTVVCPHGSSARTITSMSSRPSTRWVKRKWKWPWRPP